MINVEEKTAEHEFRAYSVRQFCERLGISPSTLWKLLKLNKIKVIRVGGRTLIPHSELRRILETGVK